MFLFASRFIHGWIAYRQVAATHKDVECSSVDDISMSRTSLRQTTNEKSFPAWVTWEIIHSSVLDARYEADDQVNAARNATKRNEIACVHSAIGRVCSVAMRWWPLTPM